MTTIPPQELRYVLDGDERLAGALQTENNLNDLGNVEVARDVLGLRSMAFRDDIDFQLSSDTSRTDALRRELVQMIDGVHAEVEVLSQEVGHLQDALASYVVSIQEAVLLSRQPPDETILHQLPPMPVSIITVPPDGTAAMQAWIKNTAPKIETLRTILRTLRLVTDA